MWSHILTFSDVHAMRAASEVSRHLRHMTRRPESWGSVCVPAYGYDPRSFVHAFPTAMRSAPRVAIESALCGFRLVGDAFRCLCRPTFAICDTVASAASEAASEAAAAATGIGRTADERALGTAGSSGVVIRVTVAAGDESLLAGVAGHSSRTEWDPTLVVDLELRPNAVLRDLAIESEIDAGHARLLPRLFPNLARLFLHDFDGTKREVYTTVRMLLARIPRLLALGFGDRFIGSSESPASGRDRNQDDNDDGDDDDGKVNGKVALLPRRMTEFRWPTTDDEWDFLLTPNERLYDNDECVRLRVSADRNPHLVTLRLEKARTVRLAALHSPWLWPPLRDLALSGGVLSPGVRLSELLGIATLERVSLSHMNLLADDALSDLGSDGGRDDGGDKDGRGKDGGGNGNGDDSNGGDRAAKVQMNSVAACRRLDLHNCAFGRVSMRKLLRLYPRLTQVRVHSLSRDPDGALGSKLEGDGDVDVIGAPINVDDVVDAIVDSDAFRDGHLEYLHLPITNLVAFGPPRLREGGSGPDDRDRPHCRCRSRCSVFCACVLAEVPCDDACHGAVVVATASRRAASLDAASVAPEETTRRQPSTSVSGSTGASKRAATTQTLEWPCCKKPQDSSRAFEFKRVPHDRNATQCRVIAIQCLAAARSRFSPTSLIVLPSSPPPSSPENQTYKAASSVSGDTGSRGTDVRCHHLAIEPLVVAGLRGADRRCVRLACFEASLYMPALGRLVAANVDGRRARPCIVQFSEHAWRRDSWNEDTAEPYSSFNAVTPRLEALAHCRAARASELYASPDAAATQVGRQGAAIGDGKSGGGGGGGGGGDDGGGGGSGDDGGGGGSGGDDGGGGGSGGETNPEKMTQRYKRSTPSTDKDGAGATDVNARHSCLCSVPARRWTRLAASSASSAAAANSDASSSVAAASSDASSSTDVCVTSPDLRVCDATHFVDLALHRADCFYA